MNVATCYLLLTIYPVMPEALRLWDSHAKQVCLQSARSFDTVVNDKSEEAAEASTKHLES